MSMGFEREHAERARLDRESAIDHRLDAHAKSIEMLAGCVEHLTASLALVNARLKALEDGPAVM